MEQQHSEKGMTRALRRAMLSDDPPSAIAEGESAARRIDRVTIYGVGILQLLLAISAFAIVVAALLGIVGNSEELNELSSNNVERIANNLQANRHNQIRLDALPQTRVALSRDTFVYRSSGLEAIERALEAVQYRLNTEEQRLTYDAYRRQLEHKLQALPSLKVTGNYVALMTIHRVVPTEKEQERRRGSDGGAACYELNSYHARVQPSLAWNLDVRGTSMDQATGMRLIQEAMDKWSALTSWPLWGAINNSLSFDGVDQDTPDGICEIAFGQIYEQDGSPSKTILAVTLAWIDTTVRRIAEWDIQFNTAFGFGDASKNPELIDFRSVSLHELGHGFGLLHSDCSDSVMFPYLNRGQVKRELSDADVAGFQALYSDRTGFSGKRSSLQLDTNSTTQLVLFFQLTLFVILILISG
jgi:hypothetical protein